MQQLSSRAVPMFVALALAACSADDTSFTPDAAQGSADAATATTLAVTNLMPDEALSYNLALVRGRALGTEVTIHNDGTSLSWPVVNGTFKALVPLAPGTNAVQLAAGGELLTFSLQFVEQTNDHYVRPLWVEGSDGAGTFDAPSGISNTEADGIARVRIAAWMWQTFYAETMHARGRGRRTFRLMLDSQHRPIVTAARSTRTVAQLRAMTDGDVWQQLYSDFGGFGGADREKIKDVGVLSFSHYVQGSNTIQAGGALGGGHQATMHGANVFTWADSLEEVVTEFSDTSAMDPAFADDSAGRGRAWAAYATTSGAVLHELGHTFGLPHDKDYESIMYRGFDWWNRYYMSSEPAPASGEGLPYIEDSELPIGIVDYVAQWLAYDRWFTGTPPLASAGPISITQNGDTITITSPNGIRDVMFWDRSFAFDADQFQAAAPTTHTYSVAALRARFPAAASSLGLIVRDDRGESRSYDVP